MDSGKNCAVSISRGKQRKKKQQYILSPISGQSNIHAYLTVTKTVLKTEDNAHIEHQNIPKRSAEYSQGTSAETIKTPMQPINTFQTGNRRQKDLKPVS